MLPINKDLQYLVTP